jgi:hypothetical protein
LTFKPCLVRFHHGDQLEAIKLGHPLLDDYLAFVGARAATNTWLAVASDLKIFFGVVAKEPAEVTAADVFSFLAAQRTPAAAARSCDWKMVRRACPLAPSRDDSPASAACSRIWQLGATLA